MRGVPAAPLDGIGEELVRGLDGEEAGRIAPCVGVVSLGEAPVRRLELAGGGVAANAQHAVRIAGRLHG